MSDKLREYWRNPPQEDGNCPMDYLTADGWIRSGYLVQYISNILPKNAKIIELGSGVGRNLATLKFSGFIHLFGVELNENAIQTMRKTFPSLDGITIFHGPIEDWVNDFDSAAFSLVFTMAVLEHLPPESQDVFQHISRITKRYLLTVEDERYTSFRHFPRNYKRVFEPLGMKQIDEKKRLAGLPDGFKLRLFEKKERSEEP